jgi:hypothetical protein
VPVLDGNRITFEFVFAKGIQGSLYHINPADNEERGDKVVDDYLQKFVWHDFLQTWM